MNCKKKGRLLTILVAMKLVIIIIIASIIQDKPIVFLAILMAIIESFASNMFILKFNPLTEDK